MRHTCNVLFTLQVVQQLRWCSSDSAYLEHLIIMMFKLVKLFPQVPEVMQTDLQPQTHKRLDNTVTRYAQHRLSEHTQNGLLKPLQP